MTETRFRRLLFIALLLLAPALLFLVQVIFVVPPAALLAGAGYVTAKACAGAPLRQSLLFLAFLLLHLVLFGGLYYLLAWLLARLTRSLSGRGRALIQLLLLGILAGISQLPIYGSGGHGPAHLGTLQALVASLQKSYGPGAGVALGLTALALLLLALHRHRQG